jgi:AraC-like DNA-binding protein
MQSPPGWRIMPFHILLSGSVVLHAEGTPSMALEPGELVVCAGGLPHVISQGRYDIAHRFEDVLTAAAGTCRIGFEGQEQGITEMVCGAFAIRDEPLNPLLATLPPFLVLRNSQGDESTMLDQVVKLLSSELARAAPNRFATSRLIEIVFVEALRAHAKQERGTRQGWLGALSDGRVSPALARIHANPGAAWSVASLAESAALSPSRFAGRFREVIGQSVMSYVADQRMHLACRMLREGSRGLAQIASQTGYEDTAAFSRAFKSKLGVSPARWRSRTMDLST